MSIDEDILESLSNTINEKFTIVAKSQNEYLLALELINQDIDRWEELVIQPYINLRMVNKQGLGNKETLQIAEEKKEYIKKKSIKIYSSLEKSIRTAQQEYAALRNDAVTALKEFVSRKKEFKGERLKKYSIKEKEIFKEIEHVNASELIRKKRIISAYTGLRERCSSYFAATNTQMPLHPDLLKMNLKLN